MLRSIALPISINLYITCNRAQSIIVNDFAQSLKSRGACVTVFDLGATIDATASRIKNATMVIAYVNDNDISPHLYIELGIAISHKKIIYIYTNNNERISIILDALQYKHIYYVSHINIVS